MAEDNGSIAAPASRDATSVLVTDDDPTSRLLVRAALGENYRVAEAENGLLAVEAMERQHFDVAILDLDMPVMDGFGVIERARARPESRHLPIIVVTGRDDVVAIERAFALGATSFLCKPINWNVFRHQVGYVLKMARAETEIRRAKEQAERLAGFRERALKVLGREVGGAVAKIAFLSARGADAPLSDIFAAGEQLEAVLARTTRASEILAGDGDFRPVNVSASDVLADAAERALRRVGADGNRIRFVGGSSVDVHCDRDLAAEALAEVMANALAHSPDEAPLRVAIVRVSPDRVRFEVGDTGAGIPEDLLESGFEAFRSAPVGAVARAGLGLGLPIAKAIAERHGGHLGIVSEPGRGTEVFLSFPAGSTWRMADHPADRAGRIAPAPLPASAALRAG